MWLLCVCVVTKKFQQTVLHSLTNVTTVSKNVPKQLRTPVKL